MSKAWTQVRTDLADAAAVAAAVAANVSAYAMGTMIMAADGSLHLITDTAGTIVLVNVT